MLSDRNLRFGKKSILHFPTLLTFVIFIVVYNVVKLMHSKSVAKLLQRTKQLLMHATTVYTLQLDPVYYKRFAS